MSLLQSKLKFLLDENVHIELYKFLKQNSFDVKQVPKGISDQKALHLSNLELRILVTNDFDFADMEKFPREKIYSIIILKLPQNRPDMLINSFSNFINKLTADIKNKKFELRENGLIEIM